MIVRQAQTNKSEPGGWSKIPFRLPLRPRTFSRNAMSRLSARISLRVTSLWLRRSIIAPDVSLSNKHWPQRGRVEVRATKQRLPNRTVSTDLMVQEPSRSHSSTKSRQCRGGLFF